MVLMKDVILRLTGGFMSGILASWIRSRVSIGDIFNTEALDKISEMVFSKLNNQPQLLEISCDVYLFAYRTTGNINAAIECRQKLGIIDYPKVR